MHFNDTIIIVYENHFFKISLVNSRFHKADGSEKITVIENVLSTPCVEMSKTIESNVLSLRT